MFAALPFSSTTDAAVLRPASSGSQALSLTDAVLVAAAAAFVLVTLAPSVALAIVVVAGIGGVAWLGLRAAATAPRALAEVHLDALRRATATQVSFSR